MHQRLRIWFFSSTVGRASSILESSEKKKLISISFLQVLFGLLDLLGIAAIGMLGALAISGVGAQAPGTRVMAVLQFLHIETLSLQSQAAIIGLASAAFLTAKTILSIYFSRKVAFFLSRRGAKLSSLLIDKLLSKSLLRVQARSNQETVYSLTAGIETITMGVLNTGVTVISDGSLLILLSIGLFIVDPWVALCSLSLFTCVGALLYKIMHNRAGELGERQGRLAVEGNQKILEVLESYREAVVSNRRNYYARTIGDIRMDMANTSAELSFMPNVSKYVIEVTVILGGLLIGASQFLLHEATHAVAVLSVFLTASTRIAPAILRVQQSFLKIKGSLAIASHTLNLIEDLSDTDVTQLVDDQVKTDHSNFQPSIILQDVSLTYPGKTIPAVSRVGLNVLPGEVVAIVGPSGAGKTSLVDLLLGVLEPDEGFIQISGEEPLSAERKWPGAIAYVPQTTFIMNGTFRQNIGMGYPESAITDSLAFDALKLAHLDMFVNELERGLDTEVGDRGSSISGGQKQRLGIARALFTKPRLLILDEATSSLDGETEADIGSSINSLKGNVTVVLIAHRLSTVRSADKVVYMDSGKVVAIGTFDQVRALVPNFDKQTKLLGL